MHPPRLEPQWFRHSETHWNPGRKNWVVSCGLASGACPVPGLYGQARGSFSGNIVDKAGSVVPGVLSR